MKASAVYFLGAHGFHIEYNFINENWEVVNNTIPGFRQIVKRGFETEFSARKWTYTCI